MRSRRGFAQVSLQTVVHHPPDLIAEIEFDMESTSVRWLYA